MAEGVAADHIAVVGDLEPFRVAFAERDVEVVGPELDHHLEKLAFAEHRAKQRAAGQFLQQQPLLVFEKLTDGVIERLAAAHGPAGELVGNARGVELLFDIRGDGLRLGPAQFADTLIITRSWAEREAVDEMTYEINRRRLRRLERAVRRGRFQEWQQITRRAVATRRGRQRDGASGLEELAAREIHLFI